MDERPLQAYWEGKEQDAKAEEMARHLMLSTTEKALRVIGISKEDTPGRFLRNVVRLCGCEIYTRTREQLTTELQCTLRTLQRTLRKLQGHELIQVGTVTGRKDLVAVKVIWTNIVTQSEVPTGIVWSSISTTENPASAGDTESDTTATINATSTRHEGDIDATLTRHEGDIDATFEDPSLYNANTLNHYRSRSRLEVSAATTTADRDLEILRSTSQRIIEAFPKHSRSVVRTAAWQLAFVCHRASQVSRLDHLSEQIESIRAKSNFTSPSNYLRGSARGICSDLGLNYVELIVSCPAAELQIEQKASVKTTPALVEYPKAEPVELSDSETAWLKSLGLRKEFVQGVLQ